mgnify:CR=1 FL=1
MHFFPKCRSPIGSFVALIFLFIVLMGCSAGRKSTATSSQTHVEPQPASLEVPAPHPQPSPQETGSLWRDDGVFADFFLLPKARRVGDIVTVKIVESSSAVNQAGTQTERESGLSAQIDAFLGLERKYNDSSHPDFRAGRNFNPFGEIRGGMSSEFDGSGSTSRSGDLSAFMTARVTDVLGNGNLRIEGTREIEVNNEKQFITLTGIVRRRDIDAENVILSTFVSDARIAYSGVGVVDDRQRPGWMSNFMNAVWPF